MPVNGCDRGCINREQHLQICWGFPSDDFWKCYCCGGWLDKDAQNVSPQYSACSRCLELTQEERSARLAKLKRFDPFVPNNLPPWNPKVSTESESVEK